MKELTWLRKKGFEQEGNAWSKILEGVELIGYFEGDADTIQKIDAGEIKAAYLEINPEEKTVQYILFEQYPQMRDIANANIIYEDDYTGVMEWLQGID